MEPVKSIPSPPMKNDFDLESWSGDMLVLRGSISFPALTIELIDQPPQKSHVAARVT
jgi:hypothetical protein